MQKQAKRKEEERWKIKMRVDLIKITLTDKGVAVKSHVLAEGLLSEETMEELNNLMRAAGELIAKDIDEQAEEMKEQDEDEQIQEALEAIEEIFRGLKKMGCK